MEESESALESKAARMANGSYSLNDSAGKVSTEVKNGEGDAKQEIKILGEEKESSIEVKAVVETKVDDDFKDCEDNDNVKYGEENNVVKEIINVEENKDVGETKVAEEKEANKTLDGEEKEARKTKNRYVKNDLEKAKAGEDKKVVEVQSINEMKVLSEANDTEENIVGKTVEDIGDMKALEAVEDVKESNEKNGVRDVKANGATNEDKGSHLIDDKSVEELKDGKDEEGIEEFKDDDHSKASSVEKDEERVLILVEGGEGDKSEKVPKDVEMVDAEHVENEVTDVKEEGKLSEREGEEEEEDAEGSAGKEVFEKKAGSLKRKRGKGQRKAEIGEAKKKGDIKEDLDVKETKGSGQKSNDVLSIPVVSSSGRPVRERKTVERLVEVIEKGPNRTVIIEKGRGTPLKEIPNVAYKLARKKPADLKFLHQTLFGRKGKAVNFKSNLLQFSGFAWHENEEKQRTKMKEKLDKCVKETLLDLCDLFDLVVSKTNTKKDDIIVKLLDFVEAPHANSGVILAEKEQTLPSTKSRKRNRILKFDASKSSGGKSEKGFVKKQAKIESTPNSKGKYFQDSGDEDDDEVEEEDYGTDAPDEDEVSRRSESDAQEKELEEVGDDEEDEKGEFDDLRKEKKDVKISLEKKERKDVQKSSKKQDFAVTEKKKTGSNYKKSSSKTNVKSPTKTASPKNPKVEKSDDTGEKVFSRKKRAAESPKKLNFESNSKEKSSGKKAVKSMTKMGEEQKSGPSKAELRKTICKILKEVDFNTATFTDILKKLAADYKTDLTPRKAAIKLMIQEELTKMADEAEDSEDEGEDGEKEDPHPAGKKVQS